MEKSKPNIVVIGGGFAGLNFIKTIDKEKFNVILVDRNNFHSFPPLFYQVASCGLDPASISFPFRREMTKRKARGVEYHMGNVSKINISEKWIKTQLETIHYDKLVIAAGTTNNFFGNDDLRKRVFTLKSTAEALRCRNEILDRLERASVCDDVEARRKLLNFVVIGGGPTGVEIAGAIGEMKRDIIRREYPRLEPDDVSVTLIEGSDRLLKAMSPESSRQALTYLKDLLVEVRLRTMLQSFENEIIKLEPGPDIHSSMVIWTAGITGESFEFEGGSIERGPGGRFVTDGFNRVEGTEDIFALGDISYTSTQLYPHGYPQLAQVAIQQARLLAKQLNEGEFTREFVYNDKGSMATVGKNRAVADLKHLHMGGAIAWLAWMFVHLLTLMGMRNKLTALINWTWSYFTYNTSLRLLIHTTRYPLRSRWGEK